MSKISKRAPRRTYGDVVAITDRGTRVGSPRPARTAARTEAGIAEALLRHVGPSNATLCGERYVAAEAWDRSAGCAVRVERAEVRA